MFFVVVVVAVFCCCCCCFCCFLARYLRYFSHRWKCRQCWKVQWVCVDQSAVPKSYYYCEGSAVTTKTDQNAMNLTRAMPRKRKNNNTGTKLGSDWNGKNRNEEKEEKKRRGGGGGGGGGRRRINTIPAVGNGVGASSLEIRTRNCFKSITLRAPIQPVCCVWAIETKTIKLHGVSVPSQGLWYQQWDKTEIHPKNSNKSRLRLVDIGGSGGACGCVYHGKHVEKVWRHRRRLRLAWEWPRRVQCKLKLAMPEICIVISNFF